MAQAPTASPTHIVIRPNRLLSFRGMVWLFLAYLGLMAVIGAWVFGYWCMDGVAVCEIGSRRYRRRFLLSGLSPRR